jgi:lipopolysaccharide transport system ATP-binding protein
MSDMAIRAEGLGKRYHIGRQQPKFPTLRESLARVAAEPIRRLSAAARGQPISAADDQFWALKDLSFEVEHGEVMGVIGRNGAGKSTLLKILSRITEPTEGYVDVRGRVGSLLEVGTGFHPELTGRENIYLNGAILGMKRAEIDRKFDEIVAFAEIDRFLDTPVKHYSSGMYVRLAFAVAAHLEPEILVVDEVLAVGDAEFQRRCLGRMQNLAGGGRTVLFVSHNLAAIRALCSRALLLHDGHLVIAGPVSDVVSFYYTQNLHAMPERNWMRASRGPGNNEIWLVSVRVVNQLGDVASEISTDEPFCIEITYWNEQLGSTIGTTVVLCNQEGICVFSSIDNHDPLWHGKARTRGLFRSRCHVPASLLSDGRYDATVLIWEGNYNLVCKEDQAVSVNLFDGGSVRNDYFGGFSGVIRPLLEWDTEQLEEQRASGAVSA